MSMLVLKDPAPKGVGRRICASLSRANRFVDRHTRGAPTVLLRFFFALATMVLALGIYDRFTSEEPKKEIPAGELFDRPVPEDALQCTEVKGALGPPWQDQDCAAAIAHYLQTPRRLAAAASAGGTPPAEGILLQGYWAGFNGVEHKEEGGAHQLEGLSDYGGLVVDNLLLVPLPAATGIYFKVTNHGAPARIAVDINNVRSHDLNGEGTEWLLVPAGEPKTIFVPFTAEMLEAADGLVNKFLILFGKGQRVRAEVSEVRLK